MKVFFSRGMDELDPSEILVRDGKLCEALADLGMSLVNPYKLGDYRRAHIAGISEIVEEDLRLLGQSDFVLADLSLQRRDYVGAIIELARAYDLGKQTYVWVGNSGNEKRIWLKYHATAICKNLEEVVELLKVAFTDEGQRENHSESIKYYSNIATGYDENLMTGRFLHRSLREERFERFRRESDCFRQWMQKLMINGTIIDLGSGTGRWVPIWLKHATRIVCVDASAEMLRVSRGKNNFPIVEHVKGDILDINWLERFLGGVGEIDAIVLGFVLGALTLDNEKRLLDILHKAVKPGATLVLLENQSSIFSSLEFFSRTEIQRRFSLRGDQVFRIYKRNFLAQDARRVLGQWGAMVDFFHTENYFIAGVAQAD